MLEKIILVEPRGFCEGVRVAIEAVENTARAHPEETIYVRHEIVHNKHVVKRLVRDFGVKFVDDLYEIPHGSRVVFSAHGTHPEVYEEARRRNLKVTDATCMLVEKTHKKARSYAENGYEIIFIGHEGHQETIGTLGQTKMHLVQSISDVEDLNIPFDSKVAYITQTTLSKRDVQEIVSALHRKFPRVVTQKDDICYATTNRQEAVMAVSRRVDAFLVVGEKNSSNSQRLVEVAKESGRSAYLISNHEDIEPGWVKKIKNIAITSGASVPENLVMGVAEHVKDNYGGKIEKFVYARENVNFPSKIIN